MANDGRVERRKCGACCRLLPARRGSRWCSRCEDPRARRASKRPEYQPWYAMIIRCERPGTKSFDRYGGSGIVVADEWRGFPEGFLRFVDCIGVRPSKLHTIDRVDGSQAYVPGNVRWATPAEQARNRRSLRLVTLNGKTMCVAAWAERQGLTPSAIYQRVNRGVSADIALTKSSLRREVDYPRWGARFGTRVVVGIAPRSLSAARVWMRCDCGRVSAARVRGLRDGAGCHNSCPLRHRGAA
jgi:hypothetical protein